MSNIHKLPAGLDQQGRYKTRDTASRQVAAEQTWAETMQVQRSRPLKRTEKRLSQSRRAWIIVGCCALAWLALLGIGAAVFGMAVFVAAMVAA